MLPKRHKIKKQQIPFILSRGRMFSSPYFTARVFLSEKANKKFSFVVSRKVSPKATERNRLKRRGFSAIQKILGAVKKEVNVIFFFKKEATKLAYREQEKEIEQILNKAGVL